MAALMWSILLLVAASVSCSPVQQKLELPDWWPEDITHPEWIPWPPTHPDWIPWPPTHPDWIPWPPTHPEWIPWPPTHPEWIPWPLPRPEWWPEHITWPPPKPEWWPEDGIDWESIDWPTEKPDWWPEIDWENLERPEINEGVVGTTASIDEIPSIVQIEVGSGEHWTQGCVGTVLTSRHILSSASCFVGRLGHPRFRRIRAGSDTRNADGVVIPVEAVISHPSYGESDVARFDGDISIVRLLTVLVFDSTIAQSPIVSDGFLLPNDLTLTLASWGATAQGQKKTDDALYTIDLVSLDSESCSTKWEEQSFGLVKVTSNMICAIRSETGGRNADVRDVGAPLYYDNILIGIVSWGRVFGNQTFPVVATSVASYTNWILQNAV